MDTALSLVARRLAESRTAVAFTGAGISTESGVSDFRSPGGVWSRYRPVYFDEFLASHEARLRYWRMKQEAYAELRRARPNRGHEVLARWEQVGRLRAVITQNIDGLHADAGSRKVLELHGTARYVSCLSCDARWTSEEIWLQYRDRDEVPLCERCGGLLKSATVSFGQVLPQEVLGEAFELAAEADVFLAMGSSLVVEPAALLPAAAKRSGALLVIVNREETPLDDVADVVVRQPLGETLATLDRLVSPPITADGPG